MMQKPSINARMAGALRKFAEGPPDRLDPRLARVLEGGLAEESGCIFLSALANGYNPSLRERLDGTGLECFVNHFHVENRVPGPLPYQLGQAVLFAKGLGLLLEGSYPGIIFRIIVSQNDQGTIIRFHKVRSGESYLDANLENYKDEAVWTCLTSVPSR